MRKAPCTTSPVVQPLHLLSQIIALSCVAVCLASASLVSAQTATQRMFFNPIYEHPDPFITYADGFYYLLNTNDSQLFTDNQQSVITIAKSRSLAGLALAEAKSVWSLGNDAFEHPSLFPYAPPGSPQAFHWYLYFTVYTQNDTSYVLESDGPDPQGSYHLKATICTGCWDLSVMQMPDQSLYLLGTTGNIFLQSLVNPYTSDGAKRTYIAVPNQPWESNRVEAPIPVLHFNAQHTLDRLSIVYSANDWQSNEYALGLLTFSGSFAGDSAKRTRALLNSGNWTKPARQPVFGGTDPGAQAYGAATFTIFPSPDNTEFWFAYSAWRHDPTNNSDPDNRDVRAQKLSWNSDGTPNLGSLVPLTTPLPLPSGDPGITSTHGLYPGAWYRVFNKNVSAAIPNPLNRLCLDNQGGGSSPGAFVELYPCHGLPAQDWQVLPSTFATGAYKVMNLAAGLALDDDGGVITAPAHLQLWTDNFSDTERWLFTDASAGFLAVCNLWSAKNSAPLSWDAVGAATVSGTLLQLWTPNGGPQQSWLFAPKVQSGLYYKLINQTSQMCLTAAGALSDCGDDSGSLNWQLQETSLGFYRMVNQSTGSCLAALSTQTPLLEESCDASSLAQNWSLTDLFNGYYNFGNGLATGVLDATAGRTSLQPLAPLSGSGQTWRLSLP